MSLAMSAATNPLWALLGDGNVWMVEAHRAALGGQAAMQQLKDATSAMVRGELGDSVRVMREAGCH